MTDMNHRSVTLRERDLFACRRPPQGALADPRQHEAVTLIGLDHKDSPCGEGEKPQQRQEHHEQDIDIGHHEQQPQY